MPIRKVSQYFFFVVLFAVALIAIRFITGRSERDVDARRVSEATQRCIDKVQTEHAAASTKNDAEALRALGERFGLSAGVVAHRWSDLLPAVAASCSRRPAR
jgi:uncharacterized membrane protein (DUF106 family)